MATNLRPTRVPSIITTAIAQDTGLAYYRYDEATNRFEERSRLPE